MIDIRDAINDLNHNVDFIQSAGGEQFMVTPGEIAILLAALQAENAERDKEIERLTKKATLNAFIKYAMRRACEELVGTETALTRVEAERDGYKRALHLAIETHSVDQRQIDRLERYYLEQARSTQGEE